LAALLVSGCQSASSKKGKNEGRLSKGSNVSMVSDSADLTAYVARETTQTRQFNQTDPSRRKETPQVYRREVNSLGRTEGILIGRAEFPLGKYLDPHSRGEQQDRMGWPSARGKTMDAFFMTFDPPLLEWPLRSAEGEIVVAQTKITAFEHDGVPFANGTCRRTMKVAGFESVKSGDEIFHDVVRMEAQTDLTFGWMANIRVFETAWYARGTGLIRREERFHGRALWLFRFHANSRYELADKVSERVTMVSSQGDNIISAEESTADPDNLAFAQSANGFNGLWSKLAICMQRTGRRIRVTGVAIEWATPPPPASMAAAP